jgi:hypothetical protein
MAIKLSAFESLRYTNRSVYQLSRLHDKVYSVKFLSHDNIRLSQEGRPIVHMRNAWLLYTVRVVNAELGTN